MKTTPLTTSETVLINGKYIYYEVYGSGKPLFLLHGYSQSLQSWMSYIDDFAEDYAVYLIDLPGHGKSGVFEETLSIKSVAEDINSLIAYLKLERIKTIGFSFGGDVLFQLSLLNPFLIESMIAIGSLGSWCIKDHPDSEAWFVYENAGILAHITPFHASDTQIRAIFEQFKNYSVRLSNDDLQRIQHEVLLVLGDDDGGMPLEEVVRVRKHLPQSDLWILPNVSHGAHEGVNKGDFVRHAKTFLLKG